MLQLLTTLVILLLGPAHAERLGVSMRTGAPVTSELAPASRIAVATADVTPKAKPTVAIPPARTPFASAAKTGDPRNEAAPARAGPRAN